MKKSVFLLFSVITLLSVKGQQNNFTNKDLIGAWEMIDSTEEKMTFQFIDSLHFTIKVPETEQMEWPLEGTYILKQNSASISLIMTIDNLDTKIIWPFLIKWVDRDTIKMLPVDDKNSTQWTTDSDDTRVFIRKKP